MKLQSMVRKNKKVFIDTCVNKLRSVGKPSTSKFFHLENDIAENPNFEHEGSPIHI